MTKRDYIQFAAMIKARKEAIQSQAVTLFEEHDKQIRESELVAITLEMLDIFSNDNPRFDREKFLDACGMGT